jgi:hypothetical protein
MTILFGHKHAFTAKETAWPSFTARKKSRIDSAMGPNGGALFQPGCALAIEDDQWNAEN